MRTARNLVAVITAATLLGGLVLASEGPTIRPDGGTFDGPMMVAVTPPGREYSLRVTVDGSDPAFEPYSLDGSRPMTQSYAIKAPFRLASSATVKARMFKADKTPAGPIRESRFTIKPKLRPGVPFYPVDWNADVETWWKGHALNPKSPQLFAGAVQSPSFRVNVAEIRERHPESTTAGIDEALAMAPPEGGTLWFPKDCGPYVITKADSAVRLRSGYLWGGAIKIRRRNNLHFLSDGATIRCDHTAFGIAGDEIDKYGQVEHPATNFYFNNLVFDGHGKAGSEMLFMQEGENFHILNTSDVLFDDCRFVGSVSPKTGHGGLLSIAFKSDNIWCRHCHFDSGLWGVYWDGVHGGGLVNCTFGNRFTNGGFVLFTNDDLSPFDFRLREAQYIVVAGCTFGQTDETRIYLNPTAWNMSASNCLFVDNTVNRAYRTGLFMNAKICPDFRPYRYHATGNRIIGNRFDGVDTLLVVEAKIVPKTHPYRIGNLLVRDNTADGLETFLETRHQAGLPKIHDIEVANNRLRGPRLPRLVVQGGGIEGLRIKDNLLAGETRSLVASQDGALPAGAVILSGNRSESNP